MERLRYGDEYMGKLRQSETSIEIVRWIQESKEGKAYRNIRSIKTKWAYKSL